MKNACRIAVVAATLLSIVVVASPALAAGSSDVTVGQFLQEIAKVNNLSAISGGHAAAALREAGVNLPHLELNGLLTEGDVAAISKAMGLNVTTSTPQARFDNGQMNQFMSSFSGNLDVGGPGGGLPGDDNRMNVPPPPKPGHTDPRTKGKGKKKGLFRSPSEPL